ncbi:hypothetical protein J6E39_08930 [bacterium]|nr:hypothetical protein [bacterium]
MKKFLTAFILLLILSFQNSAFAIEWPFVKREKPLILFNKNPINPDNVAEFCDTFNPHERIYYLITIPEKNHSRFFYIQIIKLGKYERLGYELVWGDLIRLKDEQQYYYTDYIVLGESGNYVIKVYSKDNPKKVYAMSQFWVN